MEINTGMKIASIEEVAYRMGYIDKIQLATLAKRYKQNGYGKYLEKISEFVQKCKDKLRIATTVKISYSLANLLLIGYFS